MHTISLSGWGQPADALQEVAPGAMAVDYARHDRVQPALQELANHAEEAKMAIGWSLGGQMLVRAIAAGLIRPQRLVLIATPFQFVARKERRLGMPADLYQMFRANYADDPARTLAKAWASIVRGDNHAAAVRHTLEKQDKREVLSRNWLAWLDILEHFTCDGLDFGDFPPTLIIHGREDAVVYYEQALEWQSALKQAKLVAPDHCGHAPHWHSPAAIQQLIHDFSHV